MSHVGFLKFYNERLTTLFRTQAKSTTKPKGGFRTHQRLPKFPHTEVLPTKIKSVGLAHKFFSCAYRGRDLAHLSLF